mmetsp:Transcript_28539/g.67823  ORF Transcript_28539/g.67823 Transcript_28539/m.67823 type:complete len:346 (+) Transcript_28539:78-1115(+)|eukprot:CAMPEP_0181408420 /NCGR_PEP_ID=MMETSP1110-20121109/6290_1 /TAXON_ID=174948 /ORGANISM="Symbiodinium sp., Strain CCMP421" /LENGTH=345 /DNA_ID=CAMNT_0023530887 /DNA_START=68 /DNA_END=1105 /DNA_ORIENTATION=+
MTYPKVEPYKIDVKNTFLQFSTPKEEQVRRAASCPPRHCLTHRLREDCRKNDEDTVSTAASVREEDALTNSDLSELGAPLRRDGEDSAQKKINKELMTAAKRHTSKLLEVVSKHMSQMNAVNLATAFHRIARNQDKGMKATQSTVFKSMLEIVEDMALHEQEHFDGRMPAKCCTIIAWSCASLHIFPPNLFSSMAKVAARDLTRCETFEVTNLLWAFAQLQKLRPETALHLSEELLQLLDAVAATLSRQPLRNLKATVLISALVSVANFPRSRSLASQWLFTNTSQELALRWPELSLENKNQITLAFQLTKAKHVQLYQTVVTSLNPDMSAFVCQATRRPKTRAR